MERVLKKAIERRADVERFPPRSLLPHREDGEACPRCPGTIVKETIGGRSSYYCDRHQRRAG
jgi:formamidopyrimidine-DNA glycosylase